VQKNRIEAAIGAAHNIVEVSMRVLVTGGRDYSDRDLLFAALDRIHQLRPITVLIHGAAKGVDTLASDWARSRKVLTNSFPPNWQDTSHADALVKHTATGRAYDARAGFRRNQFMFERGKPDFVLAFPGGSGTKDMVDRASDAHIRVQWVYTTRSLARLWPNL
jgi:hypothetical protein